MEIIAEIAQGYEGNSKLSELLVKGALVSGADAVKMQLVFADELCIPSYPYYDLFKSLEMPDEVWVRMVDLVHAAGKAIYFDVYGKHSLSLAKQFGVDGVKVSTTDFYNSSLIKQAFETFDNVFLSIGGVPIDDIHQLINKNILPKKLTLMHGFQAEPTNTEDNNLARIISLREEFPFAKIGFMDHSLGCVDEAFQIPLVALGLGINCIEKHITLDYSLQIEDYISALSVDRFGEFVKMIRTMEAALGKSDMTLTSKEIEYKKRAGKSVVANRDLKKGERICEGDLSMKRVSTIPNNAYYQKIEDVVGMKLAVNLTKDSPFEKSMMQ